MADFIAVIRRAVSGLTNNTPEMRAKVYDKARGAVVRQLENMSPRPSEDMFRRQLDKLESAIREVEAEHVEALPAAEEEIAAQEAPAPEADELTATETEQEAPFAPQAEEERAAPEETYPGEPAEEHAEDEAGWETPAATPEVAAENYEPVEEAKAGPFEHAGEAGVEQAEAGWHPQPATYEEIPAHHEAAPEEETYGADVMPAQEHISDDREVPIAAEPASYEEVRTEIEARADEQAGGYEHIASVEADQGTVQEERWADEPVYAPAEPDYGYAAEPRYEAEAAPVEPEQTPLWQEPVEDYGPGEPLEAEEPAGGPALQNRWPEMPPVTPAEEQKPVAMPEAIDLLEWDPTAPPKAAASGDSDRDEFDAWIAGSGFAPSAGADEAEVREARAADAVIGSAPFAGAAAASRTAAGPHGELPDESEIDQFLAESGKKAYRAEPRRKRNFTPLILALAGLVVLGGGGYALWLNRDAMNEFVSGLVNSAAPPPQTATDDAPAQTETPQAASDAVPLPTQDNGASTEDAGPQKFTQRLLADGTETDSGPAEMASAGAEGRSVSEQNVPSEASENGTPSATPSASSSAPAATEPATSGAAAVPAAGEKALLYEERVNQPTPTGIEGRIEWTELQDTSASAQPEHSIQGRLTIPASGLTALITFKRNSDPSLPASHLIEIVFAVPPGFEGGAIDEVQRVVMKRTEQERGDALVAVSAKVTDDTYLVALNDFQDVVARNIDLLRTRQWVDIPVTYRNGRRALLTLDKGRSGQALFEKVIREWSANASGG